MSGNKNWSLPIPALASVNPMDPTGMRFATGPYSGTIIDSEMSQPTEPGKAPSIKFIVRVTEPGKFQGGDLHVYMGTDFSKEGNQKAYKALLLSIGATNDRLGTPLTIGPDTFKNKNCYVYVQAAPEGEKDARDNRNFITADVYQREKAKLAAQANVAGAAGGQVAAPQVGTAVGAPPAFGGAAPALPGAVPQPLANGVNQLGTQLGAAPVPGAPTGGTIAGF